MITVLCIAASPRRHGNSSFLAQLAADAAVAASPGEIDARVHSLAGAKIAPCRYCMRCKRLQGECSIADDFQELRDLWLQADSIIYSAPVFHMGLPGQLRCFLDRLGQSLCFRFPECPQSPKLMKTIGAIAQGQHMAAGQEQSITAILHHALIMGCIPVTGDAWECYIGAGGWTCDRSSPHALEQLSAENELGARAIVTAAESLGRRAAELTLFIQAGLAQRIDISATQPTYERALQALDDDGSHRSRRGA